jgi:hypothetical protein
MQAAGSGQTEREKQHMEERLNLLRWFFVGRDDAYGLQRDSYIVTAREPLTEDILLGHLEGRHRVGICPVLLDGNTQWLAFDLDEPSLEQARRIYEACQSYGMTAVIERSRAKGFHILLFFSEPIPAWKVRCLAQRILKYLQITCEIFPKQDHVHDGGVGNFLFLPWQGHSVKEGRTVFVDPVSGDPYQDQLSVLRNYVPVSSALIDDLTNSLSGNDRDGSNHDGEDTTRQHAEEGEAIHEGTRHNTLMSVAGTMRRRGLTSEEILAALRAMNTGRCAPPLPDEEVRQIAGSAGIYQPEAPVDLPRIDAGDKNLGRVTDLAWKAVVARNKPERLFLQGGTPVRTKSHESDEITIELITADRLRYECDRAAYWCRQDRREGVEVRAFPPVGVVKNMLAHPHPPLPALASITRTPLYASDETLIVQRGYTPRDGILYVPPPTFRLPQLPERPSNEDIAHARQLIEDDLLGDFPFISQAEKAHAFALILQQFVRRLINGPTPLYLIEKPSAGTGATLLIDVLTHIVVGRPLAAMSEGRNEEEYRKRITAKLRQMPQLLVIDNVTRLDSPALAAALTSVEWEDRLLGYSEIIRLPVQCGWVATGNNPPLSREVARRTLRIRLDARCERPWLRDAHHFRHPNLRSWVKAHRSELIWAILVLLGAWLKAGRPKGSRSFGMFESWAESMSGILEVAGVDGFLTNLEEFYESAEAETNAIKEFVAAWARRFGSTKVEVSQLFGVTFDCDLLDLGAGNERRQRIVLGKLLGTLRDQQYGEWRIIDGGKRQHAQLWKLERVGPKTPAPEEPDKPVRPAKDDLQAVLRRYAALWRQAKPIMQ